MTYLEMFQIIRDRTKDTVDAESPDVTSTVVGRFMLFGLREIMGKYPETRLAMNGRMAALPTTAYTLATAGINVLPIPPEFEPALEAYILKSIYALDSQDVKDESLMRFWEKKYLELMGEA
jgi:hypothetical protein